VLPSCPAIEIKRTDFKQMNETAALPAYLARSLEYSR
jgi:hypothetical protein